ncbi:MAG: PD-(D/E)XK nuclease family transposase [bacterium]|nr:PD-(D/E)XK nuclease family transposase [bacterium]MCM1373564.1 PD-(D/E)XK nuclease family transposase [Muribaculum sp.]
MKEQTLRNIFRHLPTEQELLDRIEEREDLGELFESWSVEQQQEYLGRCTGQKGFNVLYDAYFKEVMNPEYDPSRLESFLEVVIGEKVRILKVLPNDSVRLEDENSLLVTDIVVELADGSIANIEVQKIGNRFTGPRCSCYLSDMMLRQYKRIRARKKKGFSYGDIKKVYLIVLYENSPKALRNMPDTYLHRARHVFDTGLDMDLLQRCVLVSLDIFQETMQNKPIRTLLEAWLTFLGEDDPQRLTELFRAFPQFIAMYETLYRMYKDMVNAMGFFSEELRIMDRNMVKYMIDEMDDEIKRLEGVKSQLEGEKSRLEGENLQLEEVKSRLEGENLQLEEVKSQMEEKNLQMEKQNIQYQAEIQRLSEELNRLKASQQ